MSEYVRVRVRKCVSVSVRKYVCVSEREREGEMRRKSDVLFFADLLLQLRLLMMMFNQMQKRGRSITLRKPFLGFF